MTLDFIQWVARCSDNHPDAAWVSTPTDGPRYSCRDCGEPPQPALTPTPTPAPGWRPWVRRWVDSDGRAVL